MSFALGVSGGVVGGVLEGVLVDGVVAGLFFALINLKRSSGSFGMFCNFSHDPAVQIYLP